MLNTAGSGMKLQTKIILILGCLSVISLLSVFLLKNAENRKLNLIHQERSNEKSIILERSVELMGQTLEKFVYDYTYWDEMTTFVKSGDPDWAMANLDAGLATFNAHVIFVVRPDFSLVYYTSSLPKLAHFESLKLDKEFFKAAVQNGYFKHFFLKTSLGYLEMRSAPIQPGSDFDRITAPKGYMFAGRIWCENYIKDLSLINSSNIELVGANSGTPKTLARIIQKHSVVNEIFMYDISKTPIGRIVSVSKSPLADKTEEAFIYQYITQIASLLVIVGIVALFLMHNVMRPLRAISFSLVNEDTSILKKFRRGSGEFSEVTTLIERFFEQKQDLLNEIEIRKNTEKALGRTIEAMNEAEIQLQRAKDEAEDASRFKSSLLLNMSHELRTPMNGILGLSYLLEQDLEDDPRAQIAGSIVSSGRRLMDTLNSLLYLTELESGTFRLSMTESKLCGHIQTAVEKYREMAEQRGLRMSYEMPADCSVMVSIDVELFITALGNIIDNAVKYTEKGEIAVSYNKCSEDGMELACVSVKDTGIGIAEESMELIFKAFRQASEGVGRRYEGTGIGLTISKSIVELMNGKIRVKSQPGAGSEFTILLPAAVQDKMASNAAEV